MTVNCNGVTSKLEYVLMIFKIVLWTFQFNSTAQKAFFQATNNIMGKKSSDCHLFVQFETLSTGKYYVYQIMFTKDINYTYCIVNLFILSVFWISALYLEISF